MNFDVNFFIILFYLGTFVAFDTVKGLSGPSKNGFSAGTFVDGSQAYVGYGDNSPCGGQNPCPGRSK